MGDSLFLNHNEKITSAWEF